MPSRPGALILVLLLANPAHAAELLGAWEWTRPQKDHGGFSAIEMQSGGTRATILSDRARMFDVRIARDGTDGIESIAVTGQHRLANVASRRGRPDTEGLALSPDGRLFVSIEGPAGVLEYNADGSEATALPDLPIVDRLALNRGAEALAIDASGALWTVAEQSVDGTFPVFIFRNGSWQDGPVLADDGSGFVPVGLDFDDTGRLYLLERRLALPSGFRTRLRRLTVAGNRTESIRTLLQTDAGQHDNLEGISVWRDDRDRLIATMIADDNFFPLQRTELVEYILPD